jgi:hypothetical protein
LSLSPLCLLRRLLGCSLVTLTLRRRHRCRCRCQLSVITAGRCRLSHTPSLSLRYCRFCYSSLPVCHAFRQAGRRLPLSLSLSAVKSRLPVVGPRRWVVGQVACRCQLLAVGARHAVAISCRSALPLSPSPRG